MWAVWWTRAVHSERPEWDACKGGKRRRRTAAQWIVRSFRFRQPAGLESPHHPRACNLADWAGYMLGSVLLHFQAKGKVGWVSRCGLATSRSRYLPPGGTSLPPFCYGRHKRRQAQRDPGHVRWSLKNRDQWTPPHVRWSPKERDQRYPGHLPPGGTSLPPFCYGRHIQRLALREPGHDRWSLKNRDQRTPPHVRWSPKNRDQRYPGYLPPGGTSLPPFCYGRHFQRLAQRDPGHVRWSRKNRDQWTPP